MTTSALICLKSSVFGALHSRGAYSFTGVSILLALKTAHARGVDVEVIVDKTLGADQQMR